MLFHSYEFFILLTISLFVNYRVSDQEKRHFLLLLLCAIFYLYHMPINGVYLLASLVTTYYCALKIPESKYKKLYFLFSILFNASLLIFFKVIDYVMPLLGADFVNKINISLALPLGLSFYVFQSISYTIDVYKRTIKPEPSFTLYSLYIAFFPNLVAGPIERARDLIPQLKVFQKMSYEKFRMGALLFLLGLVKKLIIADRMEGVGSLILNHWQNLSSISILIGGYAVAFQYYFDFSAYSEMALGLGKMLGIELTRNFKAPLWSSSPIEFWKRWHISLMNWLLDYIFTPILKLDLSFINGLAANFLIFLLVGAWHGVTLNFALWGIINATVVGLNMYYRKIFRKKTKSIFLPFKIFFTFHYFVLNGLFIFYPKISTAFEVLKTGILFERKTLTRLLDFSYILSEIPSIDRFVIFVIVPVILILELVFTKYDFMTFYNKVPSAIRWLVYTLCLVSLMLFSHSGIKPYVYVRF